MQPTCSARGGACAAACLAALALSACQRNSEAQVAPDPLGPVRCFQIADTRGLSVDSAVQLCAGAPSAAPAQCYSDGLDRFTTLSNQKIQQLCSGATSDEPLACYARLSSNTTEPMSEDQMVAYCATRCTGMPMPEPGNTNCLDLAHDRTDLSLTSAGSLCEGSRTAAPVQCYSAGLALGKISTSQLLQLCRTGGTCVNPSGY